MSQNTGSVADGAVYLEDIQVGMEGDTPRRTVTEADVVNFAGVSGDFNALHTDELFVRDATPFGGRIAHGLLVLSIATGLNRELSAWRLIGWIDVQRRFMRPTYPGDTIRSHWRVEEVRRSQSNPDRGIVKLTSEVTNQNGEVIQAGTDVWMVAARARGAESNQEA